MADYTAWDSLNAGLLPKWLMLVSLVAAGNSLQSYLTLTYTRQIYLRAPTQVTSLSGRTFGTWTFLSAIIRAYAACNIHDPAMYQLAFATYVLAAGHFLSEWLVFGTAGWGRGLAGPVVVSSTSLVWMAWVWRGYVW